MQTDIFSGAIDGSVVANRSLIEFNEVVPFAPFQGSGSNTTSYLQWALVLEGISVCLVPLFGNEIECNSCGDPRPTRAFSIA